MLIMDIARKAGSQCAHLMKSAESLACRENQKGSMGVRVERYFREGRINEIAEYCETDVVGTYQVWLRYELFRGTLSQTAFDASQQNLAEFMTAPNRGAGS